MSATHAEGGAKPISKAGNIALWVVQILVGLAMIAAGGMKLAATEMMVKQFEAIGAPLWFLYLTGAWELIGGVMLLIPKLAGLGAVVLIPVMIGAVGVNVFRMHENPAAALVFLALLVVIAWGRRKSIGTLFGR